MDNQFIKFVKSMKTPTNASLLEAALVGYRVIYENSTDRPEMVCDYSSGGRYEEPSVTITFSGDLAKSMLPGILSIPSVSEAIKDTTFTVEGFDEVEICGELCDIDGSGYHRGYAAQWNVSPEEPAGFDDISFELCNFTFDIKWNYIADGDGTPEYDSTNVDVDELPDELYITLKNIAESDDSLIDSVHSKLMDRLNDRY